jgi:hypothetical protein
VVDKAASYSNAGWVEFFDAAVRKLDFFFGTPQGELFHRQTKRARKRSRIRSLLRPEGVSKKLGQALAGRRNERSLDLTKPP